MVKLKVKKTNEMIERKGGKQPKQKIKQIVQYYQLNGIEYIFNVKRVYYQLNSYLFQIISYSFERHRKTTWKSKNAGIPNTQNHSNNEKRAEKSENSLKIAKRMAFVFNARWKTSNKTQIKTNKSME